MLDLSYNQIKSLADFEGELPKLMKLSLKMNKMVALKGIDRFPALTYLKLSRNNIESIQEVAKLSSLKNLKGISLYKNPLADDKQLYTASILAACPNLESLDHNACGDMKKRVERDGLQDSKMSKEKIEDTRSELIAEPGSASNGFAAGSSAATKWSKKQSSTGLSKATASEKPEFQNQKIAMVKGFDSGEKFTGQRQNSLDKAGLEKREKEHRETDYKFDEAMDDDDDDKEPVTPAEEDDDIFAMNPKSLATVKIAFDRKVKERAALLGSSNKKDEEVWLGTPTHPIGYFKRVGGNNYKIVGDGLWMLMAAKTVAIKSIDEVTAT